MKKYNRLKDGENIIINTIYKVGKWLLHIKEISNNTQRIIDKEIGECNCIFFKADIMDENENLLAIDIVLPYERLLIGRLNKYIPDYNYDPSYIGNADIDYYYKEYKIWREMIDRCYNPEDIAFPYIGAVGTIVCDRWLCFEYFLADLKHIQGYDYYPFHYENYIVDLYDIQRLLLPQNRIYAPGYVKLKPFKDSDIKKYIHEPYMSNKYPKDYEITTKLMRDKELKLNYMKNKKRSGLNFNIDLSCYQSIAAYNLFYNPYYQYNNKRVMCTIIKEN